MSLPVLHSLAGYGVYRIGPGGHTSSDKLFLLYCILLANLPDFDFLPGVIIGDAAFFHRTFTHSFAACFIAALAGGLLWRFFARMSFFRASIMSFVAYASHLMLDLTSVAPKGLQLMWPFSTTLYYGPRVDFNIPIHEHALEKATGLGSFIAAVFHPEMLQCFFFEAGVLFFVWSLMTVLQPLPREKRTLEGHVFARAGVTAFCFVFCVLLK